LKEVLMKIFKGVKTEGFGPAKKPGEKVIRIIKRRGQPDQVEVDQSRKKADEVREMARDLREERIIDKSPELRITPKTPRLLR
jgi:hypothetical protein